MTMAHSTHAVESKVWRIPELGNLELLRAKHVTQSFPRHTHEQYAVGVIEQGALGYTYRGENVVAAAGDINLCIPGEAHTGQPAAAEGWTYRMFYLDAAVLREAASEVAGRARQLPFFQFGVVADVSLARQLRRLHLCLEERDAPLLEQETLLVGVLAQLISRHADDTPPLSQTGREPHAVTQVKHYLESHYAEDVSLSVLSNLTQLSRYHLIRVFGEAVGVPPYAYLRQVRVRHAKNLLASGYGLAEVAFLTGFSDQSHLTRWFKRLWGVTPGQYRNSVQDGST